MKEYIFTYEALKRLKDSGGKLNWNNISVEQLKYLFVDENIISSNIADLYDVSLSKVAYKRKKYNIKMSINVTRQLLNDQNENMQKHLGLITQKEINEFLDLQEWLTSKLKESTKIEFPDKYKKILESNSKMVDIISNSFRQIPSNNNSIPLERLKEILGKNYSEIEEIEKQNNKVWLEVFRNDYNYKIYSIIIPNENIFRNSIDIKAYSEYFDFENIYCFDKTKLVIGRERNPKPLVFIRDFFNIECSYIEILEWILGTKKLKNI